MVQGGPATDAHGALKELDRLYGDAIYRYIRAMLPDDDTAHDVWQNVFLQAYRDLHSFSGRSSMKTWLYQIARHRCLDELRSRRRRQKRMTLVDTPPDVADNTASADELLREQQKLRVLHDCLQTLSPDARAAVILRYVDGFSYQESAEVCGDKPETLRARVSRALPVLRGCIQTKGAWV